MKKIVAILMAMLMVISVTVVLAGSAADKDTNKEPVIIGFKDKPSPADKEMVRGLGGDIKYSYTIINAIAAKLPEPAIEIIQKKPRVTYVEMDDEVHSLDAELNRSWGVKRIGAGTVHDKGNKGSGVNVAILDSGINYNHPDLNANYKGGYDYINDDADPMDDYGHGTHCAGIVAAEDNGVGVVGVAPGADLYAVKVLGSSGWGYWSDVIAGIQWSVENGMQIISMSLGGDTYSRSLQGACDRAYDEGIVLVASAGNSYQGDDTVGYPAKYDSVIAVAATDRNDTRANFSSTGPAVELAAPGVDIYSTYLGNGYRTMSGTSMACPHVSGTAALAIASGPFRCLSNDEVRLRLQQTADDLGAASQYGHGLVDADEAATNKPPVADAGPDQTAVVDGTVSFDGSGSYDPDGTIKIYSWDFGDGTNIATYSVTTTHAYLTAGTYTATLRVSDNQRARGKDTAIVIVVLAAPVADAGPDQEALIGETVSFDGSGSYDPDGTIVSYDWAFGAGTTGTGVTTTHAYLTAGNYTVTLTVTDNEGATGTDTAIIRVYKPPTMHIGDIVMSTTLRKDDKIYATATVKIVDARRNPVNDVIVHGMWSGLIDHFDDGSTDSNGEVAFESCLGWFNAQGIVTFTVMDVRRDGWIYDPDANRLESNSITVGPAPPLPTPTPPK